MNARKKWLRRVIAVCVVAVPLCGWILNKGASFGIPCNRKPFVGEQSLCGSAYPQGSYCFNYGAAVCNTTQAGYGGGQPLWYKQCSAQATGGPVTHCVIKTENCTPKSQCRWSEGMGLCLPGDQVDSLWLTADGAFTESCTPSTG